MAKRTFRAWSVLTITALLGLIASISLSASTAAKPIVEHDTTAQVDRHQSAEKSHIDEELLAAYKQGNLTSYVEPSEMLLGTIARRKLGAKADQRAIEAATKELRAEWHKTHYHGADPQAYKKLLRNEERALAVNSTPSAMGLAVTGTLRLFSVAVEFAGTDTATNFSHPISVDDRTCITETVTLSGPLHNQIPQPGPRDNFSGWRASYERDYYEKLLFSTEGITERLRPDLIDPEDGQPGINVAGQTMRNYYTEVSGGKVQFDGGPKGVIGWIQVPHSEAYYGADACVDGEPGDIADMEGLPSNPSFGNGPNQLLKDIVDKINATDANFPWSDYDTDGNGVIDHVVIFHAGKDKSAGGGQQGYGALWAHRGTVSDDGEIGYVVDDRGTPSAEDDIKLAGYTMQYEDVETGVLVHEFAHDLGLPDLYDTSREGESDVNAWDLMSLGSNTGKLIGTHPTRLSAWGKMVLGWTDPQVITPTLQTQDIQIGQTSSPPGGTQQAVRVNLPPTELVYTELQPGSTQAWWTSNDQSWADVRLTRDLDLTAQTAPISISFDLDYHIEDEWDFLFLEVSIDGGATYTQTKGFEVGTNTELTTPDNFSDPHGRLKDYGGLRYGYTGSSGGWVRAYHDLSPYAGKNIKVRFRYATDAAFEESGAFIDNIVIASAGGVLLNDPVEGGNANNWTPTVETFDDSETLGAGWQLSNGTQLLPKYYLLEWRNLNGFDKGLKYSYNTIFNELTEDGRTEFRVDRVPSNVPGMLVWVRDLRYNGQSANNILNADTVNTRGQFLDGPSEGAKGGLLIVDSHPEPLRGPRNGTITTDYGVYPYPPANNWRGRVQSVNAAFTLQNTPPLTLTVASGTTTAATTVYTPTSYAALPGIGMFNDALSYYPGVEQLPQPVLVFSGTTTISGQQRAVQRYKGYAFSDADASVVVPARGYYPPRTPIGFTGKGFENPATSATVSTFETIFSIKEPTEYPNAVTDFVSVNVGATGGKDISGAQPGNPGNYRVQYGYHFQVVSQQPDGSAGTIRLWNSLDNYLPLINRK